MPPVEPPEVPDDVVLHGGRVDIQPAFEDVSGDTVG